MKLIQTKGTCFVISPIGENGSEVRRRADHVFKYIIEPVAKESGYTAIRADHISKPGLITSQIITRLVEDPLVIADLAGHNPNVFYELAIRHVARKPVIQITQVGEPIPFDVAPTRTIQLDHKDLESVEQCKSNLSKQIRSIEKDASSFDNPISTTVDLKLFREKASSPERGNAIMISMLSDLRAMVAQLLTSGTQRVRSRSEASYSDEQDRAEAQAEAEADAALEAHMEAQAMEEGIESEGRLEVEAEAENESDAAEAEEVEGMANSQEDG